MITMQLREDDTFTNRVLLQWQGMNISLEQILSEDGEKFLYARVENAEIAVNRYPGNWVKWTISKADMASADAGASTISNGSASDATSKSMGER